MPVVLSGSAILAPASACQSWSRMKRRKTSSPTFYSHVPGFPKVPCRRPLINRLRPSSVSGHALPTHTIGAQVYTSTVLASEVVLTGEACAPI